MAATIYVPRSKSHFFLNRFQQFRDEETDIKKNPKHLELVASLEDVRSAVLSAFWTDDTGLLPGTGRVFVELWLSTDVDQEIEKVRTTLISLGIEEHPVRRVLKFPDRSIILLKANKFDLERLIETSDLVAELRASRELSSFFVDLKNEEQSEWAKELHSRVNFASDPTLSVCLLDTGVNSAHPILQGFFKDGDLQAVDPSWQTSDHKGHGTGMAGIAAYGDLEEALASNSEIQVNHQLESVKVIPPSDALPTQLWGDVTQQGVALAEIQNPSTRRVICLAIGAEETRNEGKPTSWSAAIDQLAHGDSVQTSRLILVSSGNLAESADWLRYPDSNLSFSILDPAQSWNAVTVGAFTNKTSIHPREGSRYSSVAAAGALSPYSATSLTWPMAPGKWPIKPEVLFEGGNVATAQNGSVIDLDELQPLSIYHKPVDAHFRPFGRTSSATALASNFAAKLWAEYPHLWPETVRALIVHSAEWTDSMLAMFPPDGRKSSYRNLLRTCGYGVPNFERASRCLRSRLTLVSQEELAPFAWRDSRVTMGNIHLYELPWPKEVLLELEDVEVLMKMTLSYFIEPSPGEVGWKDRYRYPSHGLRFELNSPNETKEDFVRRISAKIEDEDEDDVQAVSTTSSDASYWMIGKVLRNVGSIHSDTWKGTASELATSNIVAVRPTTGWWKERPHKHKWQSNVRYALVVSISTPPNLADVDIYTPVAVQIPVPTEIAISLD